ncbi:family 78 glycoside hydrolase catalytic domain [Marinoscillum sp. MHG1-6]|uniref:family 78 glycoside hydrolase catalytic domain n=1 Tax=Marinoscillum sp. MHG1-6 TaxID=2959627 RepID=UPI0021576B5B|nr:family 78 glycoside hydrolase catalytic domain [Marinoscillum sp. MHG1-6]
MNLRPYIASVVISVIITMIPAVSIAQKYCGALRCFDQTNPSGVTGNPYFGWNFNTPDDKEWQTAYRILVASSPDILTRDKADMWNSGKVVSDQQNYVYYNGSELSSGTRYYWKVQSWDKDDNEGVYSDIAHFDVGLLKNEDWGGAKWIKREGNANEDYTYFRKGFQVEGKTIDRAMVYVSAVHDFELYLDGELLGKGPGYHYPQYQYYKTFDITENVRQGKEHLFACLTHWYQGGQGRPESSKGFILKSIVEYTDGTTTVIVTNKDWKQAKVVSFLVGQKHRNEGEGVGFIDKIDSRLIAHDWNQREFNDSDWKSSREIGEHPVEPWTGIMRPNMARPIERKIIPKSVKAISGNRYVIDLGKVYAGVPKIEFSGGKSGNEVKIMGGYTLNEDGSVCVTTNQMTDLSYAFILNGAKAVFKPMLYMGMRYLEVSGSPNKLTKDNVCFMSRHFELDENRSEFESSNEMLNQVWSLMKHSLIVGAQESFVDTPTREKGGFLGDSWSVGIASMLNMGERTMNLRILQEFLNSQDQFWNDGRINAVYPNGDGARDIPDYTQMLPIWVWDYYMITGNKQFLIDHFERINKVVRYVTDHIDPTTGLVKELSGGNGAYLHGIVDWPATMRYGYDMSTSIRTVINAYAYSDFMIMSKIAEEIDSFEVCETYRSKARDIRLAMNNYLVSEDGLYLDGLTDKMEKSCHSSQHANAMPLAMGIASESNIDILLDDIKSKKMSMGMVTLRWLPEAIGEAGDGSHLLDLYTRTDWDGWANIISQGATMTWESWDALQERQSLSHPWGAVGLLGIQQYILGVKILEPQYSRIQIKPLDFKDGLKYARGVLPSDRGDIEVNWSRTEDSFRMLVTIPDNVEADIYLPDIGLNQDTPLVKINGVSETGVLKGDFVFAGAFKSGKYELVIKI